MGNRSGIIRLPGLGLDVSSSQGLFDAGALSENFKKLNSIAGGDGYRVVAAFDPTGLVIDTWTHVPMPNPVLAALAVVQAAFEDNFRFSNVYRLLCARIRAIHAGGGSADARLYAQFRKGAAAAVEADEVLLNPMEFNEVDSDVQNVSGFPKEEPNTMKVFGLDQDPISLWLKRNADWTTIAAVDLEIMVQIQMLDQLPPATIIES